MTTLLSFQPPPPPGCVTVLEHECQFISLPDNDDDVDGGRDHGQRSMLQEREAERRLGGGLLHNRLMAAAGIQVVHTHTHTHTFIDTYLQVHVRHVCVCA